MVAVKQAIHLLLVVKLTEMIASRLKILVYPHLVDPTQYAKSNLIIPFVLAGLIMSVHLLTVGQNVLSARNVHRIKLVLMKNAQILVSVLVEIMLNVMLSLILLCAVALKDLGEMHLLDVFWPSKNHQRHVILHRAEKILYAQLLMTWLVVRVYRQISEILMQAVVVQNAQ